MRSLLLASAGLLFACKEVVPLTPVHKGALVGTGAAQFSVVQKGDAVAAVFLGGSTPRHESWIIPAGISAIEQFSGCPVLRDSVETSQNTIFGQIDCAGRTGVFLRTEDAVRGRTTRSGLGSTQAAELRNSTPAKVEAITQTVHIP